LLSVDIGQRTDICHTGWPAYFDSLLSKSFQVRHIGSFISRCTEILEA